MLKLLLGSNYGCNDTAEGEGGRAGLCSVAGQTARLREFVAKQLRPHAFAQHSPPQKKKTEKARVGILWTRS